MSDAPIRIYRAYFGRPRPWHWECGYCHYGYTTPWETEPTWAKAISAVDAHIKRHHEIGTETTWANALERR